MQIAYLADGDVPMAFCILADDGGSADVAMAELYGLSTATWADGTHRFILIGGEDDALVQSAANAFRAQL